MSVASLLVFVRIAATQGTLQVPQDGLVSFWDFQEQNGPFISKLGRGRYALEGQSWNKSSRVWRADNVGISRVHDAPPGNPFGPRAASINDSQLLIIPNTIASAPLLDIRGDSKTLSMVAWMKADPQNENHHDCFGHLAGIWSEAVSFRQYVLFGSKCRAGDKYLNDAEVSRTGTSHSPCQWSISYAIGAAHLDYSSWHMVAMTFDGKFIRSYVNGTLDRRPPHRIYSLSDPCNETWQNPASVTTWSNRSHWGPAADPVAPDNHTDFAVGGQKGGPENGSPLGHQWYGLIGGLAVYDRALSDDELSAMASTMTSPEVV